jgi:tRNA(Arg) A34 adenosine deaminase TadA
MNAKQHNLTAFIYDRRGKLLSMGKNSYIKTHPMQAKHAKHVGQHEKQFLHAEILAIARCKNIEKAHKIVVMRFREDGSPGLAKPCEICQHAISLTPIKKIEYTVSGV